MSTVPLQDDLSQPAQVADQQTQAGAAQESAQSEASQGTSAGTLPDFTTLYTLAEQQALNGVALQSMATALSLTLHNAVAEQQHGHMLRMAMTTAATNALLEGRTAEAEAVLKLAESKLVAPDLSGILDQIRTYLDAIAAQMAATRVPEATDTEASPDTAPSGEQEEA